VPRHEFVPVEVQSYAYLNRPIPIGFDKTISQPLIVAVMTDLLELKPDDVLLEIGTGLNKVIVTAAPDLIPPPLINQLRAGGRMVIPVGLPGAQQLVVAEKDLNGRVTTKEIMPVLFSVLEESDQPAFRAS
jgi:protein-L-isoaspartate(D-aspartate) O-methyltransferase